MYAWADLVRTVAIKTINYSVPDRTESLVESECAMHVNWLCMKVADDLVKLHESEERAMSETEDSMDAETVIHTQRFTAIRIQVRVTNIHDVSNDITANHHFKRD